MQVYYTQYFPHICSHIFLGNTDAGTFQAREPKWRNLTTNTTAEGSTQVVLCKPLPSRRWLGIEPGAGPAKQSAPALQSALAPSFSETFDSPFLTTWFLLAYSQGQYSLAREPPG